MFDLEVPKASSATWDVDLPIEDRPWSVGLITGPSGCGKSTIARGLFGREGLWLQDQLDWCDSRSIIDGFDQEIPIREVTEALCGVGFSSPPAWLRPYCRLSTGQQFRADLARLILHTPPGKLAVCDEFTSVVDRVVAQVGSCAVARAVRKARKQFVAVSCHEDVIDWLQPDWIYRPAAPEAEKFAWRSLRRRPAINLEVSRVSNKVWPLFAPHHYLSHKLAPGSWNFLATWKNRPVAFSSWTTHIGPGPLTRREHRTVVLPDYQGVGIGSALCECVASMWKGLGYKVRSTTTHPAFNASRRKSPNWKLTRAPSLNLSPDTGNCTHVKRASTRLTSGWLFVGDAMPLRQAKSLLCE
jgi:GNAT superfamily N-acetyltransferase